MNLVFGMVRAVFEFFVDIGNRVDFLGLNLFHVSFLVFMVSLILRFLFPVVFAGAGSTGSYSFGSGADYVRKNMKFSRSTKENK